MSRPEIVMQTPAAKKLEAEVQRKLAEYSYSTADDVVMAEYVVVMLANAKTPEQITAELSELIGEDMYDPAFTTWLFEEVARQYGVPSTSSISPPSPLEDAADKLFPSTNSISRSSPHELGDKIETVNDSRDHHPNHRPSAKRSGHPSNNPNRPGNGPNAHRINQGGVFNQAVTGLKRSGTNDILRDTPPHRRPRQDDYNSLPNGARSIERNQTDPHWHNGPLNGQRPPLNNFPVGHPMGAESAAKSILERVGMSVNPNPLFHNPGFPGNPGGYNQISPQFRRPNELGPNGRPHPQASSQQQRMFYGSPSPYPLPLLPTHPFPQQPFNSQHSPNPPTPQLFLANGQPYIPPHPFHQLPGSAPPAMYPYPIMHPSINQSPRPVGSTPPSTSNNKPTQVPVDKRPAPTQPSEPEMPPLPSVPLLKEECKYNLACRNAWCPSSHCSPKGHPKSSMLLSFYPCELQLKCSDPECLKAHVSPQQADPKSSIKVNTNSKANSLSNSTPSTAARTAMASNGAAMSNKPIPCRFGSQCARADCVFTHPWIMKSTAADGTFLDKDSSLKTSFIPCKFGLQCTRPDCFYQHPTPQKIPSKNISKTFNNNTPMKTTTTVNNETSSASNLIGLDSNEKLTPSKKFSSTINPSASSLILTSSEVETKLKSDPTTINHPNENHQDRSSSTNQQSTSNSSILNGSGSNHLINDNQTRNHEGIINTTSTNNNTASLSTNPPVKSSISAGV